MRDTRKYYGLEPDEEERPTVKLHELGPTQVSIVNILVDNGATSAADITEKIGKTRASINVSIRRLKDRDVLDIEYHISAPHKPLYTIDTDVLDLSDNGYTLQTLSGE